MLTYVTDFKSPELPEQAGVYYLLNEYYGVIYVGESVNLQQRHDDHEKQSAFEKFGAEYIAFHLTSADQRERRDYEAVAIATYNPPLNVIGIQGDKSVTRNFNMKRTFGNTFSLNAKTAIVVGSETNEEKPFVFIAPKRMSAKAEAIWSAVTTDILDDKEFLDCISRHLLNCNIFKSYEIDKFLSRPSENDLRMCNKLADCVRSELEKKIPNFMTDDQYNSVIFPNVTSLFNGIYNACSYEKDHPCYSFGQYFFATLDDENCKKVLRKMMIDAGLSGKTEFFTSQFIDRFSEKYRRGITKKFSSFHASPRDKVALMFLALTGLMKTGSNYTPKTIADAIADTLSIKGLLQAAMEKDRDDDITFLTVKSELIKRSQGQSEFVIESGENLLEDLFQSAKVQSSNVTPDKIEIFVEALGWRKKFADSKNDSRILQTVWRRNDES